MGAIFGLQERLYSLTQKGSCAFFQRNHFRGRPSCTNELIPQIKVGQTLTLQNFVLPSIRTTPWLMAGHRPSGSERVSYIFDCSAPLFYNVTMIAG